MPTIGSERPCSFSPLPLLLIEQTLKQSPQKNNYIYLGKKDNYLSNNLSFKFYEIPNFPNFSFLNIGENNIKTDVIKKIISIK